MGKLGHPMGQLNGSSHRAPRSCGRNSPTHPNDHLAEPKRTPKSWRPPPLPERWKVAWRSLVITRLVLCYTLQHDLQFEKVHILAHVFSNSQVVATSYTLISAKVPRIQVQTAPSGTYAYILIASPSHPSSGGTPCCSTNESRIVRSLQHGAWRWRPETTLNNYNISIYGLGVCVRCLFRGVFEGSVSGCVWECVCDFVIENEKIPYTHTPPQDPHAPSFAWTFSQLWQLANQQNWGRFWNDPPFHNIF